VEGAVAADPAALPRRLSALLAARGLRIDGWEPAGAFRHGITTRVYAVTVWRARAARPPARAPGGEWIPRSRLGELPLTARARKALALLETKPGADRRAPMTPSHRKGRAPHGRR
jgi:hypothetical protein